MAVNLAMHPLVGNDCVLYYNASTLQEDPTWVEINEASDVSLTDWNVSQAEVVTRASDWAVNLSAKFRAAIEFQYLWGADWLVLNFLKDKYLARESIEIAFMDGPVTDPAVPGAYENFAQGLRMWVNIEQFPINQNNEEAVMVDTVRLVPALKFVEDVITVGEGYDQRDNPYWYAPNKEETIAAAQQRGPAEVKAMARILARGNRFKDFEGGGFVALEAKDLVGSYLELPYKGSHLVFVRKDWRERDKMFQTKGKDPTPAK